MQYLDESNVQRQKLHKSGHQGLRGRGNEEFLLNENRTSVWEDEKSSQD